MNETCTEPGQRVCVICRGENDDMEERCRDDGGVTIDLRNDPLLNTRFAETYAIHAILGFGATSVVYKATHVTANREFALKVMHPHLVADALMLRRFELESHAASSLNHDNVITVYESGICDDKYAYFVMEYLEGTTLEHILDDNGFMVPDRAVDIFVQIANGLGHAHNSGVLHRDLKASNIFVYNDEIGAERAKLLDFGIAKMLVSEKEQSVQLSRAGEICGTPTALSPEQCHGKPLDVRSDIYSLGCLMYEVLSGTPPFIGDTIMETMQKHVNERAQEFEDLVPELQIPWSVGNVVFRCLEKNPDNRYQTTDALVSDLVSLQLT
jgi:serine/threonine protein kinase